MHINLRSSEYTKAQIAYNAAIQLWSYQGQELWNRSNVMFLAHTIILSSTLVSETLNALSRLGMAFAGMLLCVLWLALISRGFNYMYLFVSRARYYESQLGVNIARKGEKLHHQGVGTLKARDSIKLVVLVFFTIYVVVFLVSMIIISNNSYQQ